MKPVKVTAELIITPEMFREWCDGDLPETERMYQHFVENMVHRYFGLGSDYGDFINKTSTHDLTGLKLTIEELNDD